MQRLQAFLGQRAFEMRDARVLDRSEDLLDSICQHVDLGVECLLCLLGGKTGPCPPGIDGDVEEGGYRAEFAVVVLGATFALVLLYVEARISKELDDSLYVEDCVCGLC